MKICFLSGLFFLLPAFSQPAQPDSFNDSVLAGNTHAVHTPAYCQVIFTDKAIGRDVSTIFSGTSPCSCDRALEILDSLGFFWRTIDTLSDRAIEITTHTRARIRTIKFTSRLSISTDSLSGVSLPCPYSAAVTSSINRTVLLWYAERGYPFVVTSLLLDTAANDSTVMPVISVTPGNRCCFAPIKIGGTFTIKPRLIAHDIEIRPGGLFHQTDIDGSLMRLRTRSYIKDADVLAPYLQGFGTTPDSNQLFTDTVVVPFIITDRKGLGIDGAVTAASGDGQNLHFAGAVTITLQNLFKTGESADFSYRGDNKLQALSIAIAKPWLFNKPLFTRDGFGLEIKENDYSFLHGDISLFTEWKRLLEIGISMHGHEATQITPVDTMTNQFYGFDFFIQKPVRQWQAALSATDFLISSGIGIAYNDSSAAQRLMLKLDGRTQIPLTYRWALGLRTTALNIFSNEEYIIPVEMFRIGGRASIRGYSDNEFAFRNVAYATMEMLYYFGPRSSLYLFGDAGAGVRQKLKITSDYSTLAGFGAGLSIPINIGQFTLEWAKNKDNLSDLGRIHVGITSALSTLSRY